MSGPVEPTVLREVVLTERHQPTGKTRHYRESLLPPPARLQIAQYRDDPGFYLLYFDSEGCEQTDTYHATLDDAMEQARSEFEVTPEDWRTIKD